MPDGDEPAALIISYHVFSDHGPNQISPIAPYLYHPHVNKRRLWSIVLILRRQGVSEHHEIAPKCGMPVAMPDQCAAGEVS